MYSLGESTSSGNFLTHAKAAHGDSAMFAKVQSSKLTNWIQTVPKGSPATSQFDLNRDIVLWLCKDLLPFELIEKEGFQDFNKKNVHLNLPSSRTLATTALADVYMALKSKVKEELGEMVSGTIMLDGWTDAHHRYPYVGVRLCTVDAKWNFRLFTLCVKPVESHKAEDLAVFVREILEEFLPQERNILLFNTTDGAANMVKLSRLLGHDRVTCIAHSLHNLVMTDTLNKIPELQALIVQCKEVVNALHFKAHLIDEFVLEQKEAELYAKIQTLQEEMNADSDDPIRDTEDGLLGTETSKHTSAHTHKTLKTTVPTRWNSVLNMIRSLISLQKEVNEILKRVGKPLLCLQPDDLDMLANLTSFLEEFEKFTMIVSEVSPNLSVITLIRARIKKNLCGDCKRSASDEENQR